MRISEMHYEIDRKYNKQNSNSKVQFSPLEKDAVLNEIIPKMVSLVYKGDPNKIGRASCRERV